MSMAKKTKLPDAVGLVKLIGAAYRNAASYHGAASSLLAAGNVPLALSNATLGFEELGKANLCATALAMPPDVRAGFADDFGKTFGDHVAKAGLVHFGFRAFVSPQAPPTVETLIEEVGEAALATHAAKMRGQYVDVDDNGVVHEPMEIDRLDAEVMVGLLGRMLEKQSQLELFALADPADVVMVYQQVWDSPFTDVLQREANADPDAFIAEVRAAMRGEAPIPGWIHEAFPGLLAEGDALAPAALQAAPIQ